VILVNIFPLYSCDAVLFLDI